MPGAGDKSDLRLDAQGRVLCSTPPIDNYAQVTGSGTVPVALTVNGAVVAAASQALPAGGDFTLLL